MPVPNAIRYRLLRSWPNCGPRPLVISADSFFNSRSKLLAELTLRHGVLRYTRIARSPRQRTDDLRRQNSDMYPYLQAPYTGRILKGEKPADLPVATRPRSS